jgi:hypothetical protein
VSGTTDTTNFWHGGTAILTKLKYVIDLNTPFFQYVCVLTTHSGAPAYTLFATQHAPENVPRRQEAAEFTGIFLILVRLEEQKTDIVISVNVPHVPGEYKKEEVDLPSQKMGPHLEAATTIRQRILETFEVKDWTLFVNEE